MLYENMKAALSLFLSHHPVTCKKTEKGIGKSPESDTVGVPMQLKMGYVQHCLF